MNMTTRTDVVIATPGHSAKMEYVKSFQSKRKLRFNFNDLSSLLLYSGNKDHMKLTHIKIKEDRVNSLSVLIIFFMVSTTIFFIFYL